MVEETTTMAAYLFVYTSEVSQTSVIRAQMFGIWKAGSFLSILAPTSYVEAVPVTYALLPAVWLKEGEYLAATVLKLNMTKSNHNLLSSIPLKIANVQ